MTDPINFGDEEWLTLEEHEEAVRAFERQLETSNRALYIATQLISNLKEQIAVYEQSRTNQ